MPCQEYRIIKLDGWAVPPLYMSEIKFTNSVFAGGSYKDMKKLRQIWKKIDKYIYYILAIFLVIFQVIDVINPPILEEYSSQIYLTVISAMLFIMFDHIINLETIENISTNMQSSKSFSEGMSILLKDRDNIDCLYIFSHTSMVHYQYIYDKHIKIKNLKLLVLNPNRASNYFSLNEEEDLRFSQETDLAISYWINLKEEGYIEHLQIGLYDFIPSFYFSIVNNLLVHYGLFSIQKTKPSMTLLSHHAIFGENPETAMMVEDFKDFFEKINNMATNVYKSTK